MSTNKTKEISKEEITESEAPVEEKEKSNFHKMAVVFNISAEGKKIIDEFKQYLIENKKVSSTLRSYLFDVNSFIEFVETDGTAFNGKFTLQNYKDFIEMQVEKKFKINTINKRINSLQQFNIFLLSKEYMDGVIIILKKDKLIEEK